MRRCKKTGCLNETIVAKGLCGRHYQQTRAKLKVYAPEKAVQKGSYRLRPRYILVDTQQSMVLQLPKYAEKVLLALTQVNGGPR